MGFWAHGTTVSFNSQTVGGLTEISLPEQSKDDVDHTSHDSEGDREYLPGLREGGTVTLAGNLLPADDGQNELRTNYEADASVQTCVITLPLTPAVTYTFQAYVNALGGDLPYDAKGDFSATIKVAGPVVKATAGS